ncbi:Dephospho-CoA kinase domain-containing protein [Hordeum vulgare]|nr:Dephospho-CoA kinase domain-containing protein [Hordeum vulgare]
MRLVGFTGGIASGKSTVSGLFKSAGVPVVDADVVARNVVQKGTGGWKKIVKTFGNDILLENGEIDRALLVITVDILLLFETKMDRWTNPVVVVWVDPKTHIERLMLKDGCSEEQAQSRISAQLALDWKKSEPDIVINNSGSVEDTKEQFREVLKQVSAPLTWKERMRSRDGFLSIVICTAAGVLLARICVIRKLGLD